MVSRMSEKKAWAYVCLTIASYGNDLGGIRLDMRLEIKSYLEAAMYYNINILITTFLTIFRRFPTTFRRFPKILQSFLKVTRMLPIIFRRLPKKIEDC